MKNLTLITAILLSSNALSQTYTFTDPKGHVKQRTTIQGQNGSTYDSSGAYKGSVRVEQNGYSTTNAQGQTSTRTVKSGDMFYTYDSTGRLINYGKSPD